MFFPQHPIFVGKELTVSYPEVAYRYIRVVVVNEDDAPITWSPTLSFDGVLRAAVFEAREGNTYTLYYGNDRALPPRYDLARYFQYIESTNLRLATLGSWISNPAYTPPAPPSVPYTARHPRILDITLVFLVAAMLFIIAGYVKKLKMKQPPHSG